MDRFNLILIAILAIPVLILELLYERYWLRDIYMASKETTPEWFRNRLKRFREYEKKVARGR